MNCKLVANPAKELALASNSSEYTRPKTSSLDTDELTFNSSNNFIESSSSSAATGSKGSDDQEPSPKSANLLADS